ncbi:response regulator [Aliifodinibius sp. S!AR15-10]|uniref:response regulator n=1 Tax=Aliifodinibius sp. S!AR15-10 TaxID=2950437 RepID=UPI002866508D|nr:response regulator [Aliifodinibius sp. S!AR15-10]MDR8393662.1 response regulator [Aliifodinibius sp. S!AR15-10]
MKDTPKKILIVEDDMLLSLVEERLIEKLGHQVVGKTGTGEEAVEKFMELKPDLILMDIVLKGEMDGIQAMQEIREISDVPVIYLSGNSDRYNYERAKQTQFTDYLVKPVSSSDLAAPLDRVFSKNNKNSKTPKRSIKNLNTHKLAN